MGKDKYRGKIAELINNGPDRLITGGVDDNRIVEVEKELRSYFKIRFTHQIMNAIRQKALYMQISVIPNYQPTVIGHPPEAAFNDPTPAVSLSHTDGAATTGFAAFSLNGGNGGFDPPSAQSHSKRTTIISFVSHQFLGPRSGASPAFAVPTVSGASQADS